MNNSNIINFQKVKDLKDMNDKASRLAKHIKTCDYSFNTQGLRKVISIPCRVMYREKQGDRFECVKGSYLLDKARWQLYRADRHGLNCIRVIFDDESVGGIYINDAFRKEIPIAMNTLIAEMKINIAK